MIEHWLRETTLAEFREQHFQRAPFVQPGSARAAVPLLGWETLAELLARRPDMFVVKNGKLRAEPADPDEARALFAEGYSFVVRACEDYDDGLNHLAGAFETAFSGDVTVHAFATPKGFHSFGWHYDCEDVFLVQTSGAKEYRLRPNTVNPEPTIDAMPKDMQFARETTAVIACTLLPGDWLYIPRGFWHVGRALEDSLGISIGVLTAAARGARAPRPKAATRRRR